MEENDTVKMLEAGAGALKDQHQKITTLTTELYAHVTGDDEEENKYFGETIPDAVKLFTAHFKTQENLMVLIKASPEEWDGHKKDHREFLASINEHVTRFRATKCADLLVVASYTKRWVLDHAKKYDKTYAEYFNKLIEGTGIEALQV
ncbi:MAG: hemerythrin family protein [Treponema sp.]|jgi:hemerythrin-like metal-binding protein|nr:hemerythrin family protein [Treponema sp.]